MAGAAGFEPAHDGIKTRCLTAWLRPNKKRDYELCKFIMPLAISPEVVSGFFRVP